MKYFIHYTIITISICFYACQDNGFSPNAKPSEPVQILNNYFVQSLCFDSEGNAWIGTLKQGILKYDGEVYQFNSKNSILPDSFSSLTMDVDKSGTVWIGSEIGLIKYSKNEFEIFDGSNSPIQHNIYALAIDHNNSIWFTNGNVYEGGVIKYDNKNWTYYTPENSELPSTIIHDIAVDEENTLWFTSFGSVSNYENGKWIFYTSENTGVNLDWVDHIAIVNHKTIWISYDYGSASSSEDCPTILKFEYNNWKRIEPPIFKNKRYVLTDIFCDSKDRIWLAQGPQLLYYSSGRWNYCCELPSSIFEIKENKRRQIWLGTGDGIYSINMP